MLPMIMATAQMKGDSKLSFAKVSHCAFTDLDWRIVRFHVMREM